MKYRYAGKEKTLSFGVYPSVSLAEARDKQKEAKGLLAKNIDPSADKAEKKLLHHIRTRIHFRR